LIPGIGVSYTAGERLTVFGGVHRGFAPPRTEDVVTNQGGVVDLDPELSWNYELGFRSTLAPGLRLDSTFYRMDYENQIVAASLAGGVGAALILVPVAAARRWLWRSLAVDAADHARMRRAVEVAAAHRSGRTGRAWRDRAEVRRAIVHDDAVGDRVVVPEGHLLTARQRDGIGHVRAVAHGAHDRHGHRGWRLVGRAGIRGCLSGAAAFAAG
jgi:outer membrane receptor for Fe3+-dicitrate